MLSRPEYAVCSHVSGPLHTRLFLSLQGDFSPHFPGFLPCTSTNRTPLYGGPWPIVPRGRTALSHALLGERDLKTGPGYSQLSTMSDKCSWTEERRRKEDRKEGNTVEENVKFLFLTAGRVHILPTKFI